MTYQPDTNIRPILPRLDRLGQFVPQLMRDSGYLLLAFPIALIAFLVSTVGLSVGLSTAIVYIGVFIAAATLTAAHGFAELELRRQAARGVHLPSLPPPAPAAKTGFWGWLRRSFSSAQRWREVAHSLLALPLSCITWSLAVAWWVGAIGGLTSAIWEPITHHFGSDNPADNQGLADLLHLGVPNWVVDTILGVVFAVTLPWVMAICAWLHALLAKGLLTPTARAAARWQERFELAESQSKAEVASLRRLERDLHDGPQQRLIRLGMDLATAQRRLESGSSEQASALLEEAKTQAELAVAELRALSRGIAPPILADRGLSAALTAVAASSPLPTSLKLLIPATGRWSEPVETTIYFAVCEALANAAKHAQAGQAQIEVSLGDSVITAVITDDGVGGAALLPGHGLAGLADRLASVGGSIQLDSPAGVGTKVLIEVPCG